MQFIPPDSLKDVVLIRPPSRDNQFTVLATATLTRDDTEPKRVLLHQSKHHQDDKHSWQHSEHHQHKNHHHNQASTGLRQDFITWHRILSNGCEEKKNVINTGDDNNGNELADHCWPDQDSHLVRVLGQVDSSCSPSSSLFKTLKIFPGSYADMHRSQSPTLVMDYYPHGTLRQALDRGDFRLPTTTTTTKVNNNNETKDSATTPDWKSKLMVLKDIAKALHFIQRHMLGQQHGLLSSDSIFLDHDGHAFLNWHESPKARTISEIAANGLEQGRWFAPDILKNLTERIKHHQDTAAPMSSHKDKSKDKDKNKDKDEEKDTNILEIDQHDDMYSFGMLAWEIATEELPFESVSPAVPSKLLGARFKGTPPLSLLRLIHQWTDLDRSKRPSWCTVVSQLDGLNPDSLENEVKMLKSLYATKPSSTPAVSTPAPALAPNLTPVSSTPPSHQQQTPRHQPQQQQQQQVDKDKSQVVDMMESVLDSTFYRRDLPRHLDSLTALSGRKLFREMIVDGTAENFFPLCTAFNTQSDPAFCGVSSLSMVLNALSIDPRKQWRGVWRWYSDEQLDCCASLEIMKQKGITFNQFACLARCHAKVVVKRADRHSLEEFRNDIERVSRSDEIHMVLSFSRTALGQTGSGHFSPIGGFHKDSDKALVMDTARFKYPPFFATVPQLWESLLPEDPETGICRGYFLITTTAKQRLDVQRKRLESMSLSPSSLLSSSVSSASSSTVSLPSLADSSTDTNGVADSVKEPLAGEGDASECDCECATTTGCNSQR